MIEVMLRRRLRLNPDMHRLNASLMFGLSQIQGFWSGDYDVERARVYATKDDELGSAYPSLVPGLKGEFTFIGRFPANVACDESINDDSLSLTDLDPDVIDYQAFCRRILPQIIKVFEPYRGVVETDNEVAMADWEIICDQSNATGRDIDGRDTVYRIWPVSFFDEELCQRSFGMGAADVVARAKPECEDAYLLAGGAYLLVSSEPLTGAAALDALDARVKARLA